MSTHKRADCGRRTKLPLLASVAVACLVAFSLGAYALLATHNAVLALRLIVPLSVVYVLATFRKSG